MGDNYHKIVVFNSSLHDMHVEEIYLVDCDDNALRMFPAHDDEKDTLLILNKLSYTTVTQHHQSMDGVFNINYEPYVVLKIRKKTVNMCM